MQLRVLESRTDRPLRSVRLADSSNRRWNGFHGYVVNVSGGFTASELFETHYVCMLAGPPLATACHCDGRTARRFQLPGELDVIPVGSEASWQDSGPSTFVAFNIEPSLIRTAADGLGVDPDRLAIEPQIQLRDPLAEHVCWALKAELESPEPAGTLYADSLGLALAAHLLRRYAPLVPRRITQGLSKRQLRRVLEYIAANLTRDLMLSELADVAQFSPSHFNVLFKQSVGLSVHQHVIKMRVERAISLILHHNIPLCDVALQAGFANQSHMARCIRRIAGTTPGILKRSGR